MVKRSSLKRRNIRDRTEAERSAPLCLQELEFDENLSTAGAAWPTAEVPHSQGCTLAPRHGDHRCAGALGHARADRLLRLCLYGFRESERHLLHEFADCQG